MRANIYNLVRHLARISRPASVVEAGSMVIPGQEHLALRLLFAVKYIGCDIRPGRGVDLIADATVHLPPAELVLCCDALEHIHDQAAAMATICRSSKSLIFIATPFAFPIHAYPSDYWRFTCEGLADLFYKATEGNGTCITGQQGRDPDRPHTTWLLGMVHDTPGARQVLQDFRHITNNLPPDQPPPITWRDWVPPVALRLAKIIRRRIVQ